MEHNCNTCDKSFKSEESLKQHILVKHVSDKPEKVNLKKYFTFIAISLIILLSVFSVSSYLKKPGQYDDLAKCLTEKEVIVYGNDHCSYTIQQLNLFGKSQKHLNYIKCIENSGLCDNKNVDVTPTWEIEGKMYEKVQALGKLAELSGC